MINFHLYFHIFTCWFLLVWWLSLKCATIICPHFWILAALVLFLHHRSVLRPFTMFVTDCTTICTEKVKMWMKKMNPKWNVEPHGFVCFKKHCQLSECSLMHYSFYENVQKPSWMPSNAVLSMIDELFNFWNKSLFFYLGLSYFGKHLSQVFKYFTFFVHCFHK